MSNVQQRVNMNRGTTTSICGGHVWKMENGIATFDGVRIPEMDNIAIRSQATRNGKIYVNDICLTDLYGQDAPKKKEVPLELYFLLFLIGIVVAVLLFL